VTALLALVLADLPFLALAGAGLAGMGAALGWRLTRVARLRRRAAHAAFLARDGRVAEARIHAQAEPRALAALLAAIDGDVAPSPPRFAVGDLFAALAVHVLPALAVLRGLDAGSSPEARVPAIASAMVAAGFLVPLATLCGVVIIGAGRASGRSIRGATAAVVAGAAKVAVDAELAAALRRAGPIHDPRGA
jgi:hypothetical protein